MPDDDVASDGLSSPEGQALVRQLIRPRLPHDIHDYVLEGICKALDGTHIISVVKTGGGKTTYFSGYMIALQELHKQAESSPVKARMRRTFPDNPLMILIYPTKGLEGDMEILFNSLGLPALAINEDTLAVARRRGENLWITATSSHLSFLLLSPEQLTSKHFNTLLQNKAFCERIVALGIDELHLILDWGSPFFRKAFRDIGLILPRLPQCTTLFGVTATLPAKNVPAIMDVLGLRPGSFFFRRRSNRRPDVQFILRRLRHGLQGWAFPDLKWVVEGQRKTIIYCDTISLAFRVFVYLWHASPDTPARRKRFLLYCSLFSEGDNLKFRQMFINDPDAQVLIATDALKVGNDIPNAADVIILNPKDPNDIKQKEGRYRHLVWREQGW